MKLTRHAKLRLKERAGLHQSAMLKTATLALQRGAGLGEVAGSLLRYLTKLALNHPGRLLKIYDLRVWCFGTSGTLITVFMLPGEYRAAAGRALTKKKGVA